MTEPVPSAYQSLWEARQELLGASYGTKCSDAYKRAYGPFKSEEEYIDSVSEIDLTREIY